MSSTCGVLVAQASCRRSRVAREAFPATGAQRLEGANSQVRQAMRGGEQLVNQKAKKARRADSTAAEASGAAVQCEPSLVIASIHREEGVTGVHTHIRQFRLYLDKVKVDAPLVTSFSWNRTLTYPVFGLRKVIRPCSKAASVLWFRHWHEVFLYHALRRRLAKLNECVVYAHEPLAAHAALRARAGPHQRVVLAIHYSISTSEEWVVTEGIKRDGVVFRRIRHAERETIPQVDGIVYVSRWARDALLGWIPEAAAVSSEIIFNFVDPPHSAPSTPEQARDLVTVGSLVVVKNHSYLLDVLAETKTSGQAFTLDIFGEGPLRSDLERKISSLGLDDQVRLRGFRSDVRALLSGYRAYVHGSYSESFCLAIVEAMAAGLPVVAGNIGQFQNSSTTASKGGIGHSTIRSGRRRK